MVRSSSSSIPAPWGSRLPAEWERHEACWLAWPSHAELWEPVLQRAREQFVALCRAITKPSGEKAGEQLEILVPNDTQLALAEQAMEGLHARFHRIPFGDIWLRDTGPLFCKRPDGWLVAACFAFNGWGGKYRYAHDDEVAARIAEAADVRAEKYDWVLEGGSVEVDSEGTLLTTRSCLLNPNRRSDARSGRGVDTHEIEQLLHLALGAEKVLWLERGLAADHTDGHVDTLARFVDAGAVLCMEPSGGQDPNAEVLREIRAELEGKQDSMGRKLQVLTVPSPGRVESVRGELMPASYLNFYLANHRVIVPTFGVPQDDLAVERISRYFPEREAVGLRADAILEGGGAFHCITQPQPAATAPRR